MNLSGVGLKTRSFPDRKKNAGRNLKKRMNGNTTGIDGGHPCWCHNGHLLLTVLSDMPEKSSFSRPRFSGQKKVTIGLIHQFGGQVKNLIICIRDKCSQGIKISYTNVINKIQKSMGTFPAALLLSFRVQ